MLTKEKLLAIFPKVARTPLDLDELVWQLQIACNSLIDDFGFNSVYRQAAFLAQTGHESNSFTAVKENLNYSAAGLLKTFKKYFPSYELALLYEKKPEKIASRVYANRMGNGTESSGDGWKYRGRGLIQLTGKDNYVACSNDLEIDLIHKPSWLETEEGAVRSALWYWNKHSLNAYADIEDIKGMTKVINGGYNGLTDRIEKYNKAKDLLMYFT